MLIASEDRDDNSERADADVATDTVPHRRAPRLWEDRRTWRGCCHCARCWLDSPCSRRKDTDYEQAQSLKYQSEPPPDLFPRGLRLVGAPTAAGSLVMGCLHHRRVVLRRRGSLRRMREALRRAGGDPREALSVLTWSGEQVRVRLSRSTARGTRPTSLAGTRTAPRAVRSLPTCARRRGSQASRTLHGVRR